MGSDLTPLYMTMEEARLTEWDAWFIRCNKGFGVDGRDWEVMRAPLPRRDADLETPVDAFHSERTAEAFMESHRRDASLGAALKAAELAGYVLSPSPSEEVEDYTKARHLAAERFRVHPHWYRLTGTPWENDAPTIAANLMCEVLRNDKTSAAHFQALWESECRANESLRASLTRVEEERDALRLIVERGAQSVALMAWEIPAPNIHTPQLIALAQSMTSAAQEARLSRATSAEGK